MPRRNSPSKVARDAKGKPVKGTSKQRTEEVKGSGETQTPSDDPLPKGLAALNWRQKAFVRYFLTDSNGNASDAARRAGYADPGLAGWRLMQNAAIAHAIDQKATEAGMTADEVLDNLTDIAAFDPSDYLRPDGTVDIPKLVAAGRGNMIHTIEPTANGVKVKLYSRKEALELLGKFRKLFVERLSFEGFDPATMTTEQLRAFVAAGKGKQGP
jgi:hypothetical protein